MLLGFYYAITGAMVYFSLRHTNGTLVYPLDDTYIHMAMAKNFAQHGVWGVTSHGFSSSTSSPLFTGILALGYFLFGYHGLQPLILNLIFGSILIAYVYLRLAPIARFPWPGLATLGFLLIVSLPALTFIGMEHILHVFLCLAFLELASFALAGIGTKQTNRLLLAVACLLPLARYEGIFPIAIVTFFLLLQKRVRLAGALFFGRHYPCFSVWLVEPP